MYKIAATNYVGLVVGVYFVKIGHQITCIYIYENKVDLMK